jgi:hypothetical protein
MSNQQKTYTVAVKTYLGTYEPVGGLPNMTLKQAEKAAKLGRDNGIDTVVVNPYSE